MNLPFLKNFKKKVLPSYFLVLVLRDEKVNAVIFQELEGKVKIVGQEEESFTNSIEEISSEEFLQILDKTISQAESTLPENIQTQKTIFGVKESWTENDQIKKEYLVKLKKASEELGLIPIGFLVISQAISHLLAKEEGAPISAILTEVNKKSVTVTLVKAGKSIETKSSEIHESIPFTVDTLLKHFDIPEILPSRIIIFNGKEDLSQEFITHTWSKSLPFLHLPQITNLPLDFDAKSVLFGAVTQMGFAVTETPASTKVSAGRQKGDETQRETKMQNFSSPDEDSVSSVDDSTFSTTESFGFAKDMDVAKIPAITETPASTKVSAGRQKKDEAQKSDLSVSDIFSSSAVVREETFPETTKPTKDINISLTLAKNILFAILGIVFIALKKVSIKRILSIPARAPKGKLTILASLILIFIIVLISSYFLFLKATIAVTIDPKITEQNKNVLFSTTETTDPSRNIIKGEFVSVSEDGSVSTATTGKKDVGTKAKGTVTVFNSLDQNKTLSEGTVLKAPNGIEFTLDSQITVKGVASHSADENPPPEKTTANVTAFQLGKESNLPSGTRFSIALFDTKDLIAKNDNPFSGGTKKEVTVVSKNDQNKLEEELTKQLENKAKSDLLKQIGQNKILLPVFISASLSKKSLNVKVGDEATQATLTGTVKFQGISYDKNDLISFSKSLLEKDLSDTQKVDYNNIKTAVLDIKNENDGEIEANLNIKALLLPKIDEVKLIKILTGKSFKTAEDLLYKLPQVSDIDIYFSPKLPFLPKNLPIIEKNIKISIKING